MDILEISHVSKSFGSNKVIDDLSFSVPSILYLDLSVKMAQARLPL